jgi:hypothetical protein
MSILEKFNLRNDIFDIEMDNSVFEPFNRGVKLVKDQPAQFMGSINGIEVPAIATLRSAKLHRLSILDHTNRNSSGNQSSFIVTGTLRDVKIDLDIVIDNNKMSITDFLHQWWQESQGKQIERELFVANLNNIGLNFDSGMSMLFQQFGASKDGYDHAVSHMINLGAFDARPNMANGGRIRHAYTFSNDHPGLDVIDMELNTADRDMSKTRQGFLNLVDAVVNNFERIIELRKTAMTIGEKLKDPKISAKDAEKLKKEYAYYREQSRKWASNWGGAQYRVQDYPNHETRVSEPGKPVIVDQVNALCGRLTVDVNDQHVPFNFWSNSTQTTPVPAINKAGAEERILSEDKDPF